MKRFRVCVDTYSLEAGKVGEELGRVFEYDTNAPKQASRILAELINTHTKRAKAIRVSGRGMRYEIRDTLTGYRYPLLSFRERFAGAL